MDGAMTTHSDTTKNEPVKRELEETENESPECKKRKTDISSQNGESGLVTESSVTDHVEDNEVPTTSTETAATTSAPEPSTGPAQRQRTPSFSSSEDEKPEESDECRESIDLREAFPSVLGPGMGTCSERLSLKLSDTTPVSVEARPLPFAMREPVAAELRRLESQGIIRKVEDSAYGTPIVPDVTGRVGLRIYGDYQTTIIPKLIREPNPALNVKKIFKSLEGCKHYSIISYRQDDAYDQLLLDEPSQACTAINTHIGTFVFQRAPCNLPVVFDKIADIIKEAMKNSKKTVVCLDHIIITEDSSKKKHVAKLKAVLSRLRDTGLRFDLDGFMVKGVCLLGHVIDKKGTRLNQDRVNTVKLMEYPFDKKEKTLFAALLKTYKTDIPDWHRKKSQLRRILEKEDGTGFSKLESNFKTLRNSIVSGNVLMDFDPDLPLVLATDVNTYSFKVGCILSHRLPLGEERPISFSSMFLNKKERNNSLLEKKAYAVLFGANSHKDYLQASKKLIIKTDHEPLKEMLEGDAEPQMEISRAHTYAAKLRAFDFKVELVTWNEARAIARLSPLYDTHCYVKVVSYVDYVLKLFPIKKVKAIAYYTKSDQVLRNVHDYLKKDTDVEGKLLLTKKEDLDKHYRSIRDSVTIDKGCVLYEGRIVVPDKLKNDVLMKLHNFERDHVDLNSMKNVARKFVYWQSLDEDIEAFVQKCMCNTNKEGAQAPAATV